MAKKQAEQNAGAPASGTGFTKVIGIDVANSTIKIWTDDASLSYRNTIKLINDSGLVYSFKTDYQMYVYNREVYEVGDISAMGSGGRGAARYTSSNFKVEAIIGITSILKCRQQNKHEILRVVTGVPSYLAKNNKIIDEMKTNLLGSHEVKSVTWDNVETITFDIAEVIVVPQPLGTMYSYVFDDATGTLNQKLLEQRAVVIDIGWGTTDIAVLESGRVRSTFGFDIGVSDFISGVQEDFNADQPDANIFSVAPHELDDKLLRSTVVETPFGEYDLADYCNKQKEIQAKKIYESVMGLGLEFNKFYKIILTGGGSVKYDQELRNVFNDPRLIIQNDAVMANARGFWLLGKY